MNIMQLKLIVLLFLSCPIFGFGQTKQSIDLVGGVDYSYRFLTGSGSDKSVINFRNNGEIGHIGWRTGFNYNRRLSNKFFVRTGLRLSSIGYKSTITNLQWPIQNNNGTYEPDPTLPHELQTFYDYSFVEIPLVGRYEFNQKKWAPFVELGVFNSMLLKARARTILGTNTISQSAISNVKKNHLTGFMSFGLNYSINDHYQIFAQTSARYNLTRLYNATPNEHLFGLGGELGIRRQLK
jgi:hypothetical protein